MRTARVISKRPSKGKGKAVVTEEVVAEKLEQRVRPKASEAGDEAPPAKKKLAGQVASEPWIAALHVGDESDEGEAKAKKKRKIQILHQENLSLLMYPYYQQLVITSTKLL